MTKSNLGRKEFILSYSLYPIMKGSLGKKSGQEPGAGPEAEAMEERC